MSDVELRWFTLTCDSRERHARGGGIFQGHSNEPRFKVRRRAAKAGWTHVRMHRGRGNDRDYCPAHQPPEGEGQ